MIHQITNWLAEAITHYGVVCCFVIMMAFLVRYLSQSRGEFNKALAMDFVLVCMATFSFIPGLLFIIMGVDAELIPKMVAIIQKFSWYLLIYGIASLYVVINFLYAKWQKKPAPVSE